MKLIELNNTVVEIARIKALSLCSYSDIDKTNRIKVELNTRNEYLFNPDLGIHDLVQNEEVVYVDFPDYETAKVHLLEMMSDWECFLSDKEND